MVKVKITSATPVVVGHKVLLPGEVHEVHPAALATAIVVYSEGAFQVVGGQTVVTETDGKTASGDDGQSVTPTGGDEIKESAGDSEPVDEVSIAKTAKGRKRG